MKIGIIGAGALGGYFGGQLVKHGYEVHFLVRSDKDQILNHGLRVDSINGDFVCHPQGVYDDYTQMPKCELVCIALKSTENQILKDVLNQCLKEDSDIVIWQNGIGLEEELAQDFPSQKIFGGLSFLCSNKIGPGHIHHIDSGSILLGEYGRSRCAEPSAKALVIQEIFAKSGIPTQLTPDLKQARWQKLLWNMPYNGLCAALNQTTDLIMAHDATRSLVVDLMFEVQKAAQADGAFISDEHISSMLTRTEKMKAYQPSMMLDYIFEREPELEYIYVKPLAIAAKHQLKLEKTEFLLKLLVFLKSKWKK